MRVLVQYNSRHDRALKITGGNRKEVLTNVVVRFMRYFPRGKTGTVKILMTIITYPRLR